MFENLIKFLKKFNKKEEKPVANSKDAAKERLHLVLMQDRANVSADFLELMKQEIIEVIKKYIEIDESAIDVRLTNKENADGTNGAPALYANIPILNIKNEARKKSSTAQKDNKEEEKTTTTEVSNQKKEDVAAKDNKESEQTKKDNVEDTKSEEQQKSETKEDNKAVEETKKEESKKSVKE